MPLFAIVYQLSRPLLFLAGVALTLLMLLSAAWARRTMRRAQAAPRPLPHVVRTVGWADLPLEEAFYPALLLVLPRSPPSVPAASTDTTTYRISSATLAAAYRYLTQRLPDRADAEPEWLLVVSGLKLPTGERTLETLIEIQLQQQDSSRAAFDMAAFTATAVTLHAHGQALHAIFHSHRFAGPPGPSGVDKALQRQLDAGYPAIQAVFSEDGYVRFFGGARPWQIEVHGRGVERLAADLYRARQAFTAADVGAYKALALARNLAPQATGRTHIDGYPLAFQQALQVANLARTVAICGVDNNATRLDAARYYHALGIPVIFLAVDATAQRGYCFVQTSRPGAPCFLCLFPDAGADRTVNGCSGASIEILKVVAGLALYAVDSLLMARPRAWTYKDVYLDGGADGGRVIAPRPGCPICGGVHA